MFTDTSPESHRDRTREPTPVSPPPSPCCPPPADNPETPGPDDLSASVNFDEDSVSSPTLRVLHLGCEIPASCLVEVKTHKLNNQPLFNAEAQLYFSQLGKLYVAKNNNGTFLPSTPIVFYVHHGNINHISSVEDKAEDIKKWIEDYQNQKAPRKVVALLKKLRELAERNDKQKERKKLTVLVKNDGMGEESRVRVTLYQRKEEDGREEGCVPGGWIDAAGREEEEGDEETAKGDDETVVGDSQDTITSWIQSLE